MNVTPLGDTPVMSERSERATRSSEPDRKRSSVPGTQLRLLQSERPRPLRARKATPRGRKAVHWADQWRLDAQTRQIGRQGVASAREALARAHDDELRRAS
jgi:hypothetical protein